MDEQILDRVIRAYGLHPVSFASAQKGYRNASYAVTLVDHSTVNFILYKREAGILERIRRANLMGDFLAGSGLPARRTVDPRIIRLTNTGVAAYGALYNYLPGLTIPWDAYTKAHIKLLGMAMSVMHSRLVHLPLFDHTVAGEYDDIVTRMQAYFEDPHVTAALRQKLALEVAFPFRNIIGLLRLSQRLPSQQVLHMDFVRSNLLFSKASAQHSLVVGSQALTGILDFEKAAVGHPVLDIARTLAFLLVDCQGKTPEAIEKYFLESGYNKRGEAHFHRPVIFHSGKKIDLLDQFVTLFLLHDFYKFLRHNPYDFLPTNDHFMRTRNILIARKMIHLC